MDLGNKLSPGQMPTASAWNNVRAHVANSLPDTGGHAPSISIIKCYARNDTDSTVWANHLVEIVWLQPDEEATIEIETFYQQGFQFKIVDFTGIPGAYLAVTKDGIAPGEWGEVVVDGLCVTQLDHNNPNTSEGRVLAYADGGGSPHIVQHGYHMMGEDISTLTSLTYGLSVINNSIHPEGYSFRISTDDFNSDFSALAYHHSLQAGMVLHLRVNNNLQNGRATRFSYIPNSEPIDPMDDTIIYALVTENCYITYSGTNRYFYVPFEPLERATRYVWGASSNNIQNEIGRWNLLYVNRALHQLSAGDCTSKYEVAYNTTTRQFGRPRLFSNVSIALSNNDGSAEASCTGFIGVPAKFANELVAGVDFTPEIMNNGYVQGMLKLDYSLTDTNLRALVTQCPMGIRPGTIQWFYRAPSTLWREATSDDLGDVPASSGESDSTSFYIPGLQTSGMNYIMTHHNNNESDQHTFHLNELGKLYVKKETDFTLAEIYSNLTDIQSFEQS